MDVRPETPADCPAVRGIHEASFDTPAEANLVDVLREQATPIISLVAEDFGEVIGHILFTPVTLDTGDKVFAMGLAPMAVLPDRQRGKIGTALVEAGLQACRDLHVGACVVLGHPDFYPRFGFKPASTFGITSEYDVPDEVFMALELEPGALKGKSGTIQYHQAFSSLS